MQLPPPLPTRERATHIPAQVKELTEENSVLIQRLLEVKKHEASDLNKMNDLEVGFVALHVMLCSCGIVLTLHACHRNRCKPSVIDKLWKSSKVVN